MNFFLFFGEHRLPVILIRALLISLSICSMANLTDHRCLEFHRQDGPSTDYCAINTEQNSSATTYTTCLRCHIESFNRNITKKISDVECQESLRCIELQFSNTTLFEHFFAEYAHLLSNLFSRTMNNRSNTLFIRLQHDQLKELNLLYLQSVLHFTGDLYSYLYFILSDSRQEIRLDLETGRSQIPLIGVRIEISCDQNIQTEYYVTSERVLTTHPGPCVILSSDASQSVSTKRPERESSTIVMKGPRSRLSRVHLLLFIAAGIILSSWTMCLCLYLYVRYVRWTKNSDMNQRSSIVSSVFSMDSFDSRRDEIVTGKYDNDTLLSKETSQRALYSFDHEFWMEIDSTSFFDEERIEFSCEFSTAYRTEYTAVSYEWFSQWLEEKQLFSSVSFSNHSFLRSVSFNFFHSYSWSRRLEWLTNVSFMSHIWRFNKTNEEFLFLVSTCNPPILSSEMFGLYDYSYRTDSSPSLPSWFRVHPILFRSIRAVRIVLYSTWLFKRDWLVLSSSEFEYRWFIVETGTSSVYWWAQTLSNPLFDWIS